MNFKAATMSRVPSTLQPFCNSLRRKKKIHNIIFFSFPNVFIVYEENDIPVIIHGDLICQLNVQKFVFVTSLTTFSSSRPFQHSTNFSSSVTLINCISKILFYQTSILTFLKQKQITQLYISDSQSHTSHRLRQINKNFTRKFWS